LIQQVTTLDCDCYWKATAVLPICDLLNPTIGQQDLQIPCQGGWVEVQTLPNLDASNGASLCDDHQKSQLCSFQTKGAEFMIVNAHENTIEDACTPQQALTRDLINETITVIRPFVCFCFRHGTILHMQIHFVKPHPEIIFHPLLLSLAY